MSVCGSCGAENLDAARFCMSCAAPLAAGEMREQRKTVTIVFCDLVGSTALGESHDAEALKEMLERYFDA
jgi:class 3 adenylate cyclase